MIIIGAGISGLACAKNLMKEGIRFLILEACQKVRGRIKSESVDGFILDHGFQVLQTAYPEARSLLDYDELDLKPFSPGVALRKNKQLFYISDPIRRPQDLWGTLTSPIGTITDRLRILRLFAGNKIKGPKGIFESTDMRTIDFLRSYPFFDRIIESFFRPFFAGVCLDPKINVSSKPANQIRLGARVELIGNEGVTLTTGQKITGKTIVNATEGPETERLLKSPVKSTSKGERCLYFSAENPPIPSPFLILNGEGKGLINNLAIPTLTAPSYSSSGRHLIAAVVLDHTLMDNESLVLSVRRELRQWFGDPVRNWNHIKTYHIGHALPDQSPPVSNPAINSGKVRDGVYTCGEYQRIPGIQWALLSGRLTAEQIIHENPFN